MSLSRFPRLVGICALVSTPLALGSLLLELMALNFDFAGLENPAGALGAGADRAVLVRSSLILDLFGYYLLLAPTAVFLEARPSGRAPEWVRLVTLGRLGYILVGAAGAAMLGAAWPPLIREYATVAGADRVAVQTAFLTLTNAVDKGLWNTLEVLLCGRLVDRDRLAASPEVDRVRERERRAGLGLRAGRSWQHPRAIGSRLGWARRLPRPRSALGVLAGRPGSAEARFRGCCSSGPHRLALAVSPTPPIFPHGFGAESRYELKVDQGRADLQHVPESFASPSIAP